MTVTVPVTVTVNLVIMRFNNKEIIMSEKKSVVLLSGGLDSFVTAGIAIDEGYAISLLTINYRQRHNVELGKAEKIAAYFGVDRKQILIDLRSIGGSALTDSNLAVPSSGIGDGIPITYVPGRNTIFVSLALAYAEVIGAEAVFAGFNHVDYSGYPNCRPEYVLAFNELAKLSSKRAVEGNPIKILAPLLNLGKDEIIRKGAELGLDLSLTHSCYNPTTPDLACGVCDSCRIRKAGFEKAGIVDPTRYI